MATLTTSTQAPDFSLTDRNGVLHKLYDVQEKLTIVFFYPKDDTPGCTIEAIEISDAIGSFTNMGVAVFGISGGTDKSKAKFCEKHQLGVTLLSDKDFETARAYGAYGDKMMMGNTFKGIFRHTYLLDRSKKVLRVFHSVKPQGHAADLLNVIKELESEPGLPTKPEQKK